MRSRLFIICLTLLCLGWSTVAAAAELVRVALVRGQYSAEIKAEQDFLVVERPTGKETLLPKGKYFVHGEAGQLYVGEQAFQGPLAIRAAQEQGLPQVNKRSYAGSYELYLLQDKLLLNNLVDIEAYLASVIPPKTMQVWPEAAVKAQIVAARSYIKYQLGTHAVAAYDLTATDEELPYAGLSTVKPALVELISATEGEYLADQQGRPIQAVTTSSSGGSTDSAQSLWGREVIYLQSVKDYDQDSPDYDWELRLAPLQVQNILEQNGYQVGKLTSLRLSPLENRELDRTSTGRVKYMFFTGEKGSARLTGLQVQQLLGLPSTLFDVETGVPRPESLRVPIENYYGMEIGSKDIAINLDEHSNEVWRQIANGYHLLSGAKEERLTFTGHGRGQGLGLSAWGARGLANAQPQLGYEDLLRYYYPRTSLRK